MPLNFPKQKVSPSWGVLKEKTKYKKLAGNGLVKAGLSEMRMETGFSLVKV